MDTPPPAELALAPTLAALLQGEMVQSKFGIAAVAARQMEAYTSAVLEATMLPPAPARAAEWRTIMDSLSELSCDDYRTVGHPLLPCALACFLVAALGGV